MLSVPFVPEERVPLIRPATLEVVYASRQHIVVCELAGRGNDPSKVFKGPVATDNDDAKAHTNPRPRCTNYADPTFSDSDDEGKSDSMPTDQADIEMARLHNRPLRKRARVTEPIHQDLQLPDDIDVPVLGNRSDAHKSAFGPSEIGQYVDNPIGHPSLIGKQAQAVLESSQHGPRTKFLRTPPQLRLSYDLSFGIRGLSLMHFRRFFQELEQQAAVDAVDTTNFGRSNAIQPASPPSNIDEIVDAFKTLLFFAEGVYNSTVCNFIKAGTEFMEQYVLFTRSDVATCGMLVFWTNSKLETVRSQLIIASLESTALIGREFTRIDDHLMGLYQACHDHQMASLVLPKRAARLPANT
ncbi:uncharacterized protein IUM83_03732 [Phytophthora cinnamomi]|uniref:uncharacterized protein n=1 Tax=Phytophthora cinnamomi TaxID=4785 RepID=UPI003559B4C1|nr:hypothetical protein IUM83_03732 [Phytophthora cinnamomi]